MPRKPKKGIAAQYATRLNPKRTVTCLVCNQPFGRITRSHLRTHDLSVTQYARLKNSYDPPRDPAILGRQGFSDDPDAKNFDISKPPKSDTEEFSGGGERGALQLLGNTRFVSSLASEAANYLASGPIRQQLSLAVATLLQRRLYTHASAITFMEQVRGELQAPWRLQQGGPAGQPTPTSHLVDMAHVAIASLRQNEDTVLRLAKLAIDEKKASDLPNQQEQFTPSKHAIPIPTSLTPAERETIRLLHQTIVTRARDIADQKLGIIDVTPPSPEPENIVPSEPAQEAVPQPLSELDDFTIL